MTITTVWNPETTTYCDDKCSNVDEVESDEDEDKDDKEVLVTVERILQAFVWSDKSDDGILHDLPDEEQHAGQMVPSLLEWVTSHILCM